MSYRILSFNLRTSTANDGKHNWVNRQAHVITEIRLVNPDVMGLQEVTHEMRVYLEEHLPDYSFIGKGRDDGHEAGEYTAIFYRSSQFNLINSGHFALSETPEQIGTFGWDAGCIRIASWVILEDKIDRKRFFFLNTHTDHEGVIAREESSLLLREQADRHSQGLPVIITGDFNASPDALSIRLLTAEPALYENLAADNADRLAKLNAAGIQLHDLRSQIGTGQLGPTFTFHDFKLPELLQNPGKSRYVDIIDYVFATKDVDCTLYVASTNMHAELCISDHLPIIADVLL